MVFLNKCSNAPVQVFKILLEEKYRNISNKLDQFRFYMVRHISDVFELLAVKQEPFSPSNFSDGFYLNKCLRPEEVKKINK